MAAGTAGFTPMSPPAGGVADPDEAGPFVDPSRDEPQPVITSSNPRISAHPARALARTISDLLRLVPTA